MAWAVSEGDVALGPAKREIRADQGGAKRTSRREEGDGGDGAEGVEGTDREIGADQEWGPHRVGRLRGGTGAAERARRETRAIARARSANRTTPRAAAGTASTGPSEPAGESVRITGTRSEP